jgi:hypothetical protein
MMSQIRFMDLARYHFAMMNLMRLGVDVLFQKALYSERSIPKTVLPTQMYICDGVMVGCKKNTCLIDRPYEVPYDRSDAEVAARSLYKGSSVDHYVVINCPVQRKTLANLLELKGTEKGGISAAQKESFEKWVCKLFCTEHAHLCFCVCL